MSVLARALEGWRILVAEDEFLIAQEVAAALTDAGARVMGPVATVPKALDMIAQAAADAPDAAVLDVNLRGRLSFPIAGVLAQRSVPFVFLTGYEASAIDPAYRDIPRCRKPFEGAELIRVMLGLKRPMR